MICYSYCCSCCCIPVIVVVTTVVTAITVVGFFFVTVVTLSCHYYWRYRCCCCHLSLLSCAEVQYKVDELTRLYEVIKSDSESRAQTLMQTLEVSEQFWDNLTSLTGTLKELEDTLTNQEPPGLEPDIIREQQETLEVC